MKLKILYLIGSITLFLGLLWMFLPHAYHSLLTEEDQTSHLSHILQGAIITVLGLILMVFSNKLEKKITKYK